MNIKSENHIFFSKQEVEHIKNTIEMNCNFDDKIMNKFNDLFSTFFLVNEKDYLELIALNYSDIGAVIN